MRGRAARWVRWIGMAAAVAIPTAATAFIVAGPAGATTATAHVSFTANGVAQQNLTIKPGTDVVFSNNIDPTQGVPILGLVTGLVQSVSVTVNGATQQPFTLQRNQQATVAAYTSGSKPFIINYSATYEARELIFNDLTVKTVDAQITVTPSASSATPTSRPTSTTTNPSPTTTEQPSQNPTQQPTGQSPTTARSSAGQQPSASSEPTISGYQAPGPNVASQVVPKGDGGTYTGDSTTSNRGTTQHRSTASSTHRSSGKRSTRSHTTTEVAAGDPVTPAAKNSANEQSLNNAANATGALPSSFNWPAIAAVALLSTVGVALVRTFAAHRRG